MAFLDDINITVHFEPAGGTEYDVYVNDEPIGTLDTATEVLKIERISEESRNAFLKPLAAALRKRFDRLEVRSAEDASLILEDYHGPAHFGR